MALVWDMAQNVSIDLEAGLLLERAARVRATMPSSVNGGRRSRYSMKSTKSLRCPRDRQGLTLVDPRIYLIRGILYGL